MEDIFLMLLQTNTQECEARQLLVLSEKGPEGGLRLTREGALQLAQAHGRSLRQTGRVEFAGGIGGRLVENFCDSPYIDEKEYADILCELQEMFYNIKNDTGDRLDDDEVLMFLRQKFNGVCRGEMELMQREIRALVRSVKGYEQEGCDGGEDEYD